MAYLYAIRKAVSVGAVSGGALLDVETMRAGNLELVFACHDHMSGFGPGVDVGADAVRRHDAVIAGLMASGPVLPFRFGVTVADAAAVAATVRRGAAAVTDNLDRVAGCAEVALVVAAGGPPAPDDHDGAGDTTRGREKQGGGRAYLERLCRRDAARTAHLDGLAAATADLRARLDGLSRASRRLPAGGDGLSGQGGRLRLSYLVPRESIAAFARTVAAATKGDAGPHTADGRADMAGCVSARAPLVCAFGPWPPYSFVADDLLEEGGSFGGGVSCEGGGYDIRDV
ncbi:GvpL/GvpF family gas vesicle protein [Eilatimonas milleporae]|uniref:Gas vesicle protein GvpL/GvpF n=1 Tax=Eilatimonas milleporae TaxID=911205 RepID=A0A3M0D7X3_9PROT|nr:GvpL/GvpF family gas vesicle protein [Eilatimonas milleporae]RMB12373.1 gas vesicle protein GvpL/GvpF [Eilatimonas milleporae]